MYQGILKFNYTYDHLGRVTDETVRMQNNDVLQIAYDYAEDTTQVLSKELTINGGLIDIQYYNYYPGGELASVDDTQYTYDLQGQLIREYDMITGQMVEYTYVGNGNLSRVDTYRLEKTGGRTLVSSKTYAYSNSDRPDLLTSYNGQSITYDMIGNPLTYRDGMSMTWVHGRQLSVVSKNGTTLGGYNYDSNGLRMSKSVNGQTTNFYYDDAGRLIRSGDGLNAIWYFYGPNDTTPQSIKSRYNRYYYVKNIQGDVTAITDWNGNIIARYTYDSWGKVLSVTDANGAAITDTTHIAHRNPIRYRGYYYDTETGFYYLRSRYYDPEIGRFLNADGYVATGQGILGHNMYAYCGNDPVNRVDVIGTRHCAAASVSQESANTRKASCNWQRDILLAEKGISPDKKDPNEEEKGSNPLDQWAEMGVIFKPDDLGNGGRIFNSYLITDGFEMTTYAKYLMYESEYASYFSGSVEGFVFEWDVHNLAYLYYTKIGNTVNAEKAKHVDIGRTIYADNHGIPTYLMLRAYEMLYPVQAREDLLKHCLP